MDIAAWLHGLGLQQYEQAFRENAIDEAVLPELTTDDLKDLGVSRVGDRRKLLGAIAALHTGSGPEPRAEARVVTDTLTAERRHLTVMFCDLVGSTALSTRYDPEDQVTSQGVLGIVLFILGFLDQALERSNAAIAEARRLAHPPSSAVSLALSTTVLSLFGDNATLNQRADELVTVATDQAFPHWECDRNHLSRMGRGQKGGSDGGNIAASQRLYRLPCHRSGAMVTHYIGLLAEAYEIAGHAEEAMILLDDALQAAERTGERWFLADLSRHKGQLLLRQGHTEAAEELYFNALRVAEEQEAKLW